MFQTLESRRFLSVAVESGVLTIRGTRASETIALAWTQVDSTNWHLSVSDGSRGAAQEFDWTPQTSWQSVSVYGGNGADNMSASAAGNGLSTTPPVPVSVNGGAGNDIVLGTDNDDTILGGSGYDSLTGLQGDDSLNGEGGKDTIVCGAGNDTAFGDLGRDKILGDAGNDVLTGGAGNDQMDGGIGDDSLSGNGGSDSLFAGSADFGPFFRGQNTDLDHDTLFGSARNDPSDPGDEIFL